MSDNFASNRAAAAFESLRRGFDGVKGPDLGMFVIDPLGAETPEMRAERKASPAMRTFNKVIVALVLIIAALVIWASGVFVGAMKPTVWNHLPFVVDSPCDLVDGPCRVVPSGERAEPEESAR